MSKYIAVEDNPNMMRDVDSGAIVYINNSENTRELKRKKREMIKEQETMKSDVEQLKNEISDIKGLLKQLLEKI